jgi:polyisoprenoid-binding protein YceI
MFGPTQGFGTVTFDSSEPSILLVNWGSSQGVIARRSMRNFMRLAVLCLLASAVLPSLSRGQDVPVFAITPVESKVTFFVKASVALEGAFGKWDSTLTFTSPDVRTGVLDIKIQAETVNTGSGMKDGKLKSKDFFDVKDNPLITFHSDKIVQTGPTTFDMPGTFTIRGVSKPETLTFNVTGKGTGAGEIKGTMAFDRKDYGMNKGIPFVTIADRVEVTVDLKGKRVSGPPLVFQQ